MKSKSLVMLALLSYYLTLTLSIFCGTDHQSNGERRKQVIVLVRDDLNVNPFAGVITKAARFPQLF